MHQKHTDDVEDHLVVPNDEVDEAAGLRVLSEAVVSEEHPGDPFRPVQDPTWINYSGRFQAKHCCSAGFDLLG